MNKLYKVLLGVSLVLSLVGLFLPLAPEAVQKLRGVTNFNNLELRPEAANDGVALLRARDFNGVLKLDVATSGQIIAASGTTYLSNPVVRDRNNAIPTIVDGAVTSTRSLTGAEICQNSILNVDFVTATGTLTLASSSDVVAQCLSIAGDKLAFPITISNVDGSGTFNLAAGVSSSLDTAFTASGTTAFGLRATSSIIASSSAHLWVEFMGASSTGGNWIRYRLDSYR